MIATEKIDEKINRGVFEGNGHIKQDFLRAYAFNDKMTQTERRHILSHCAKCNKGTGSCQSRLDRMVLEAEKSDGKLQSAIAGDRD